jgi:hypothetical protein
VRESSLHQDPHPTTRLRPRPATVAPAAPLGKMDDLTASLDSLLDLNYEPDSSPSGSSEASDDFEGSVAAEIVALQDLKGARVLKISSLRKFVRGLVNITKGPKSVPEDGL